VRDPGQPGDAGRSLARPTSHVDVLPALMRRAGMLPTAGAADPWAADVPERPVFCEGKARTAVRLGDLKLTRALPNPALDRGQRWRTWLKLLLRRELGSELHDLRADPAESRNLAGDRTLKRPLAELLRDHLNISRSLASALAGDEERRRIEEEMKRLGYM